VTALRLERVEAIARWQDCPTLGRDDAAVVVDVLRATTSMAQAAANGVSRLLPVGDLDTAQRLKSQHPAWLLVGERDNRPPPGFDRGNSPWEWNDADRGRVVVWTTSNGTAALEAAQGAGRLAAAALVNRAAAVRWLEQVGARRVVLIAAGEHGRPAAEDVLACGAIAAALPEHTWSTDAATAVRAFWAAEAHLAEALAATPHGRQLVSGGFARDVDFAARLDTVSVLLVRQRQGSGWLAPWPPPV
jgi:2-phosphosulfolactate phosphatase